MINSDNFAGGGNSKVQERCEVGISVLLDVYEHLTTERLTEVYQVENMLLKMIEDIKDIKENGCG